MDAGWFGFTRNPDHSDVVLFFKQDESAGGNGYYLAVTEDGEYRFGRTGCSPTNPSSSKIHPGQFNEGSAAWGWLLGADSDEERSDVVEIPGFVRDKLTPATPA